MANNTGITYVSALTTVLDYAKNNGFDNNEVIEKVQKLIDQKNKVKTPSGKSIARKTNEAIADLLIGEMDVKNVTKVDNKWVRDNVEGVNTAAKATAVLNVAVDMGLLERHMEPKSATRNTLYYTKK